MVNEYHYTGLRIVEVSKAHLGDFPEIVRIL
ncbi:MAG: AAA family ATPase, partial [Syntrophomonadaceae bacterium]|nr:AAA family ATPase [Syntrophomonadaceae bacterium]